MQFEDVLRRIQIAQAVHAEISKCGRRGQNGDRQFFGCPREQHLTAAPDGQQARNAIDRRSEVVGIPLVGNAGVNRHTHPESPDGTPVLGPNLALRFQRGL